VLEVADQPAPVEAEAAAWSLPRRVSFRFLFAYLVLYNLPFPINVIPPLSRVSDAWDAAWNVLAVWTGRHVLGLSRDVAVAETGSGDQTYHFVLNFCVLALAMVATIVWSVADRRRAAYPRLHDWLRVYVRYVLAWTMLTYVQVTVPVPD
jgi:hypothetical protein